MKEDKCVVCGSRERITTHHLRDIHDKVYFIKPKKNRRKAPFVGYVSLCRDCHDLVEVIVTKKKLWQIGYRVGYKKGLEDSGLINKQYEGEK